MLTGKQLVEQGIITGDIPTVNIQQHGVDLNLVAVLRVDGTHFEGHIPNDQNGQSKTLLAKRHSVDMRHDKQQLYWYLVPGVYDITVDQGCNVPPNFKMKIVHRSSLFRNGGQINSSLFDAGFKTEKMGTILHIATPIRIDFGARVAQAHVYASNEVENLYNGQFQGDKQRNS